jgi:hypothetical protein
MYGAVGLSAPINVRSEGPTPVANSHSWNVNAKIHYVFPGTKYTEGKTINVTWYDGDQRPHASVQKRIGRRLPGQGSVLFGTKGHMIIPHVGKAILLPEDKYKDYKRPEIGGVNHWESFINASRGEGKTSASFDYSGPMTEAILLGGIATRYPKEDLHWDAKKLAFTNHEKATTFVRKEYRKGWEVKGL